MASIKVKFSPSTIEGATDGSVYYQIIHARKVRRLSTALRLRAREWDPRRGMPVAPDAQERRAAVERIRYQIRADVERLSHIDRRLQARGTDYEADDVVDEFNRYAREYTLFRFMQTVIDTLHANGRTRTAETYISTLHSFTTFRGGADIMLDCITPAVMESYEAWLKGRGLVANTSSFYMRILRAVYNRAVEREIIDDMRPFRHVYTGVDKTVKRALPLGTISRIRRLDLGPYPALDYARDMFLLSFYLRGMSFVDMAFLRKADLSGGRVTYRRRKTGQKLMIEWTADMQTILDKYPANPTDYLLPVIRRKGVNERSVYRNAGYNINHSLKQVGEMAGVAVPLTLYVARHSWASAAQAKGIPLAVISEGMGHDSELTTRIYLAGLDTSAVDRANSLILASL